MIKRDSIFENLFSGIEKRFFEKRYFMKNLFSLSREKILRILSLVGFLRRDLEISLKNWRPFLNTRVAKSILNASLAKMKIIITASYDDFC